jgi:hypothetical protein
VSLRTHSRDWSATGFGDMQCALKGLNLQLRSLGAFVWMTIARWSLQKPQLSASYVIGNSWYIRGSRYGVVNFGRRLLAPLARIARRSTPVALRRFLKAIHMEPLRRVDTPKRSLYSDDIAGFLAADV